MNKKYRVFIETFFTLLAAALSALTLHVFVYKNSFAPSGVDGIATMLQETTGVNAGIYSLILNIPLLVIAYFFLDKRFLICTVLFTVLSSLFIYLLAEINFYQYEAKNERLLAAIFSGILLGIRTGTMIRLGSSTGGVDIVASIFQKKNSYINIERIISVICYGIIIVSFAVYKDITSVLLSFVQMYVFEWGVNFIMKDNRDAVEFKVITKHTEELKKDILYELKHGATEVDTVGVYTEEKSKMIISVVNQRQIPAFLNIIKKYPDTFVCYTKVMGLRGNFRWRKSDIVK
nr:YitT family protein [Clostridia bacterium]